MATVELMKAGSGCPCRRCLAPESWESILLDPRTTEACSQSSGCHMCLFKLVAFLTMKQVLPVLELLC